jgi:hypothetical protein
MSIPTQSDQKPNFIVLNRIQTGETVKKIPNPHADLIEGEWLTMVGGEILGWNRCTNGIHGEETAALRAYPVIGKPAEHMNKSLRTGPRATQGAVPVYFGPLTLLIKTKVYDNAAESLLAYTEGAQIKIGSVTDGAVTRAAIQPSTGAGITCGRIITPPSAANGWWMTAEITVFP